MRDIRAFLVDRHFGFWATQVRCDAGKICSGGPSLFDGEMVGDRGEDRYLIFDAMMINGQDLKQERFPTRLEQTYEKLVIPLRMTKDPMEAVLKVYLKDFFTPNNLEQVFELIKKLPHENDGVIFTEVEAPYVIYTNEHIYKWKSPDKNTIDFKLHIDSDGKHWLQAVDNKDSVNIAVLEPIEAEKPFLEEGAILECAYRNSDWRIDRRRGDKPHPNAKRVVELVWKSITDNVTKHDLLNYRSAPRKQNKPS